MASILYVVHEDNLLQSSTDIIIKYESYFITKCGKNLLENALGFLL